MNKLVILSLCVLFTLTVMISSCSKALDQPGYPGLRCSYGNIEYIADSAVYRTREAGVPGTNIYAYTAGREILQFYLVHNTNNVIADSIGTFTLDSTFNVAYLINDSIRYRSTSGSLTISQYYNDSLKVITGTFFFNGREPGSSGRTLNVEYGYFNNIPRR